MLVTCSYFITLGASQGTGREENAGIGRRFSMSEAEQNVHCEASSITSRQAFGVALILAVHTTEKDPPGP